VKKAFEKYEEVELVSRQSEISRVGMVMKLVEEESKAKIISMKTSSITEKNEEREEKALYFRVVFARTE
jgi:hypothetical protein